MDGAPIILTHVRRGRERKRKRTGHTHACVEITLNHGASQKALLTKLKVNKMFMSGTQSFI